MIAIAIQRGLQRLARPWYRPPAFRVFRDDTDLTAAPGLWSSIEEALLASEFFILLASPAAATSPWVNREVATWLNQRSPQRFMLALTDGELAWDSAAGDFDWAQTTVLPADLRHAFQEEPRWIDFRAMHEGDDLSLRNAAFQECVADLAAPLHGTSKERLIGEDIRRKRQWNRLRNSLIVVLTALLAVAIGAAVLFLQQRNLAEERLRAATARQLLAQAENLRASDPRTALLLGIAANKINPTGETEASLVNTLTGTHFAGGSPTGATDTVTKLAFSPDGHTLASGSADTTVTLWNVPDRGALTRLGTPQVNGRSVRELAFGPDGRRLAVGSGDGGAVVLWDVADRSHPTRLTTLTDQTGAVSALAFAPDGRTLAIGDALAQNVSLWNVADPAGPTRLGAPLDAGPVNAVTFSPDGRTLALANSSNTVTVWGVGNPAGPTRLGAPLTEVGAPIAFNPDGRLLATGGGKTNPVTAKTVTLWDMADQAQPTRLGAPLAGAGPSSLGFDGGTLAVGTDNRSATFWNVAYPAHPTQLGALTTRSNEFVQSSMAFAPDGRKLATGNIEGTVELWDVADRAQPTQASAPLQTANQRSFRFSPDGRIAATVSDDAVTVWDVAEATRPTQLATLTGRPQVAALAFRPDGRMLATGNTNNDVILWDLSDPARPIEAGPPLRSDGVTTLVFASDGRMLATGNSSGEVILWDVSDPAQPRLLATLTGPPQVAALAFAPDGGTLATAGGDAEVILWDILDRTQPARLSTLGGHTHVVRSVAFTYDSRTLATGGDDATVILWNVADPARPTRLCAPLHPGQVMYSAFTSDGRMLATAGDTVTLWDVADSSRPTQLGSPLTAPASDAHTVSFISGRRTLAAGFPTDGRVTFWDLSLLNDLFDHARTRACTLTGGGLDRAGWDRYVSGLPFQDTCAS